MSNKKVVSMKQSELINMMDTIIAEAVESKRKEWIAEQASSDKTAILEKKINTLEGKLEKIIKW